MGLCFTLGCVCVCTLGCALWLRWVYVLLVLTLLLPSILRLFLYVHINGYPCLGDMPLISCATLAFSARMPHSSTITIYIVNRHLCSCGSHVIQENIASSTQQSCTSFRQNQHSAVKFLITCIFRDLKTFKNWPKTKLSGQFQHWIQVRWSFPCFYWSTRFIMVTPFFVCYRCQSIVLAFLHQQSKKVWSYHKFQATFLFSKDLLNF